MSLLLLSFIAGILTVLAPCVLPLLPIIIGGSATDTSKWRPYIITLSLAVSLFIFTLLIKISTIFINVDPSFWKYVSGFLLVFMGLISVFPAIWDKISIKFNLSGNSDKLLDKAGKKSGFLGAALTGAALGPVFSSCSPTYAVALSTILQGDLYNGLINMLAYILGLSLIMLLVSLLGKRIIKRLRFAANPNGIFKKVLGVLFVIVGIMIISGFDKTLELYVSERTVFNPANLEQTLLSKNSSKKQNQTVDGSIFNVNPPKKAPEITGIQDWINSDPQTIASLKGKVVLIDFWTYSCINCERTLPYITKWYDNYKNDGFVTIGIHAPEFSFEKKKSNVEKAVQNFGIHYPVALDNDLSTWKAFDNQFWPAKYLIDKDGNIRYTHFGEGDYDITETAIRTLLAEKGQKVTTNSVNQNVNANLNATTTTQTAETYLGWSRGDRMVAGNRSELTNYYNKDQTYNLTDKPAKDSFSLGGTWSVNNENIVSGSDASKLKLNFSAAQVYLVAGNSTEVNMQIKISDKAGKDITGEVVGEDVKDGKVAIQADRLYKLVKSNNQLMESTIELTVPKGVRLNVFTFG